LTPTNGHYFDDFRIDSIINRINTANTPPIPQFYVVNGFKSLRVISNPFKTMKESIEILFSANHTKILQAVIINPNQIFFGGVA
jgi:hypothetical protein